MLASLTFDVAKWRCFGCCHQTSWCRTQRVHLRRLAGTRDINGFEFEAAVIGNLADLIGDSEALVPAFGHRLAR